MNAFLKLQPSAVTDYEYHLFGGWLKRLLSTKTNSPWNLSPT